MTFNLCIDYTSLCSAPLIRIPVAKTLMSQPSPAWRNPWLAFSNYTPMQVCLHLTNMPPNGTIRTLTRPYLATASGAGTIMLRGSFLAS